MQKNDRHKYRLMKAGDVVHMGDEFLQDDGETWVKTTTLFVGIEYRICEVFLPARRPLPHNDPN